MMPLAEGDGMSLQLIVSILRCRQGAAGSGMRRVHHGIPPDALTCGFILLPLII